MRNRLLLWCWLAALAVQAQHTPTQTEGPSSHRPTLHAYIHATVVPAPGQQLTDATVLVQDGLVLAVGTGLAVPAHAQVHDLKGAWIYPAFVDAWSDYGTQAIRPTGDGNNSPQYNSRKNGPYSWNQAVQPERNLADGFKLETSKSEQLRALGFAVAHASPNDGIMRGTGLVLELGEGSLQQQMLAGQASAHYSFTKGSSTQDYPSSLTGSIALIRQTFLDAAHYKEAWDKYRANPTQTAPEVNLSLEALLQHRNSKLPAFFQPTTLLDILRAARIFKEQGLATPVFRGTGYEYEIASDLLANNLQLVLPLDYPDAPDVEDPTDAASYTLAQLRRWEQAPANAAWLAEKKIPFAFTIGTRSPDAFYENLRKAIAHGLAADKALEALTLAPARMLGLDKQLGSIEKGKRANLIIASGNLFAPGGRVLATVIAGKEYGKADYARLELRGSHELNINNRVLVYTATGDGPKYDLEVKEGEKKWKGNLQESLGQYLITLPADTGKAAGLIRLKGSYLNGRISGTGTGVNGESLSWWAQRSSAYTAEAPKPLTLVDRSKLAPVTYPNAAFGFAELPKAGTVLIQHATVWTNTAQGNLTDADVLIENGKIKQVGKGLVAPAGAVIVDGTGRHLTNGIIDEHSHIAIERGVNEGTHNITAECRMGDVLNPYSIQLYRQLAGGVTSAQLLHGSANPIGAQSQIIKLRWGAGDEGLKFEGAPGFIKFALGENVKQAHWGDNYNTRYPQSRLGVEQIMKDGFMRAKAYKQAWDAWRKAGGAASNHVPPRRELQLETLLEILEGKRHITCHSYVQSEMLMLIRLADEVGFKVNTFTHVLEGYKVADKMAAHGASAMGFADWWNYKPEVYEAIPYNHALLHQTGMNHGINSDDGEMARRLNQEAAKTMKYGGLNELDAWKLVTLNPAKALRIDHRVGTVEAGKDADLVLWSAHPLSIYAKPLQTYVDGKLLFDQARDQQLRTQVAAERNRLIQKLLSEKKSGTRTTQSRAADLDDDGGAHLCEVIYDYMRETHTDSQK